jgi:phosphocarrier protein HPr
VKNTPSPARPPKQTRWFTFRNRGGLRSLPLVLFVKTASKFTAAVTVKAGGGETSHISINSLGRLGIQRKDRVRITTVGADAKEAMNALSALIRSQFCEADPDAQGSGYPPLRVTRWLTVPNKKGLHAASSAQFVRATIYFDAAISVKKDEDIVNGRDIMGLMMLATGRGEKIEVTASGPDAVECMEALVALAEANFGDIE